MSTNSWNDAVERFRNQLSAADRESLRLIETKAERQGSVDILGRKSSVFGDGKNLNLLSHVMELMRPIATVADAIAPVACVPSSSIWGAFGLIIEMTQSKKEVIEAILNNYKALFAAAPRMEGYLNDENLMRSKILQHTVQEVFEEFLNITMRCIKIFGKNESSSLDIMKKIQWMRYKKDLKRSLDRIIKLTKNVDREADKAMQARVVQAMERKSDGTQRTFRRRCQKAVQDSGEQQSLVLYGLAGIGKTQVALQYAHLYQGEHDACFWITCDNRVKISKDIAEMARQLGLSDEDRGHNIAIVNEWMSTTDQSWLLVLDNVESLNDVQGIWPSCNKGSILVTTQDSGTILREDIKHSIQILPMEHDDAVNMVQSIFKKHGKSVSARTAERILGETDSLPFSIRQLCSYICANELDPNKFLDNYVNGSGNVDIWDEGMLPSYQRTLSNFLDLTFQKLSDHDIVLVAQFAFLDPDMVQSKLLYNPSDEDE
ncbi:hypothetical protein H9Q72_011927 [Fusarium xylarioides]|uniref:AAA+ ATPase domain-containing protein n=1 Tax=Fusarium xylarioides TaxID=221167 RepID=A0A9P7HLZ6_9HYPO|nr:hypothetical protein H9Q70_010825 [Fusarium xylarioides]KAG5759962.1 hypothetical protein H9Q72_011927 [Fusarium xylarioides]